MGFYVLLLFFFTASFASKRPEPITLLRHSAHAPEVKTKQTEKEDVKKKFNFPDSSLEGPYGPYQPSPPVWGGSGYDGYLGGFQGLYPGGGFISLAGTRYRPYPVPALPPPVPAVGPEDCSVVFGSELPLYCHRKSDIYFRKFAELQQFSPFLPQIGNGVSSCKFLLEPYGSNYELYPQQQCTGSTVVPRIPYHMYNDRGEMRFIVQNGPNLQQCYLETVCNRPSRFCQSYGPFLPCKSRICIHTLLAWDPAAPQLGPFFDTFEYVCCCQCHGLPTLKVSSFVTRFGK